MASILALNGCPESVDHYSGTEGGFAYNAPKVLKASHVIALCTRNDMTEEHLQALLEQEALP